MMNFTVPDTFQVCANGRLDSVTTGPGTRTYWWRHAYPICTYLMTFSASRFTSWDTLVRNNGGDSVPIRHWMWPFDSAQTRTGYANLPRMMNYFADTAVFGRYPFEGFGHVPGYYGFPWGGMEHQTLVMLNRGYIGGGHDGTISHELSHMWWGDMVTHVGYADVWLNEGFATWAECMYMGHQNGRAYFNNYVKGKMSTYISGDRTRRFPVYDPPWELIYDYGTIYCKGSAVMHMLRWVMGDTAWESPGLLFRCLRAYGDSLRYGTASTEDFKRICEGVSGLELDWFFDEWIYQAGYPKYRLNWTAEPAGDSFRIVTSLGQSNGAQAPDFFRTPLPVRFKCLYVDTNVVIRPQANPEVDTFLVHTCPDSVKVDPDNWVLDSSYVLAGISESPSRHSSFEFRTLSVTPNPTRGRLTVRLHSSFVIRNSSLVLYDASGRSVLTRPISPIDIHHSSFGIDLGFLPSGVYYLQLSGRVSCPPTPLIIAR
jgi:aminopeptidase N